MNNSIKTNRYNTTRQTGLSMVEVLVSLIILMVGLLGLAGLIVQSQRSNMESYQRVQALILLQDIAGRINANRSAASCYRFTTNSTTGAPYLGNSSTSSTIPTAANCSTTIQANYPLATNPLVTVAAANAQAATAVADMSAWDNLLKGTAETAATGNAGAMVGARGCVSYGAGTELTNPSSGATIAGTGIYTVAVAWQGMGSTFANTTTMCGKDQYGDETLRRVVTLTFRIASLT